MQNQRLNIKSFGNPLESVELIEETREPLSKDEVSIKVAAAPINPADINYIQGTYGIKPSLPAYLGLEGSGTVTDSKSSKFKQGDKVIFMGNQATWSTHVHCHESFLILLPQDSDLLQAAMLKVNPMTAWLLLTQFTKLEPGQSVLQNASNSGVGRCIIQLSKLLKVNCYNVVRSQNRADEIRKMGAQHIFMDDTDLKNHLRSIEDYTPPLLAFNAVGGDSALRQMDCLAENGKLITYGAMSKRSLKLPNKFLIFKRIALHGLWVTKDLDAMELDYRQKLYTKLANWVNAGALTQPIEKTYELHEYSDALNHQLNKEKSGKILFVNPS